MFIRIGIYINIKMKISLTALIKNDAVRVNKYKFRHRTFYGSIPVHKNRLNIPSVNRRRASFSIRLKYKQRKMFSKLDYI